VITVTLWKCGARDFTASTWCESDGLSRSMQ